MKANAAKICVPVCVQRTSELSQAIARAAEVADVIELRLDCLLEGEIDSASHELGSLIGETEDPTILPMRNGEQGGRVSLNPHQRSQFWSSLSEGSESCLK